MRIIFAMVVGSLIFIGGFSFGAVSEPPPKPRECKVFKITYTPEVDESQDVSWGWLK